MINKTKTKLTIFFLITIRIYAFSQDAEFSQYYASELYLNPALIGFETTSHLSFSTRNQWSSLGSPFTTSQFSVAAPIYKENKLIHMGGAGISVFQNNAMDGAFNKQGAHGAFALNAFLTAKSMLSFSLQVGVLQKSISLNDFEWTNQYNSLVGYDQSIAPGIQSIEDQKTMMDLNAGIVYGYNLDFGGKEEGMGAYVGLSAFHLTQPDEALGADQTSRLPVQFKSIGGMAFTANKKIEITPNFLLNIQSTNRQINLGNTVSYKISDTESIFAPKRALAGTWYRVQDAFILIAGIESDTYVLAFSYDANTSTLRSDGFQASAYEITLRLINAKKGRKKIHSPRI